MKVLSFFLFFSFISMSSYAIDWKFKVKYPDGKEKILIPTKNELKISLGKSGWACSVRKVIQSKSKEQTWEGRHLSCSYKEETMVKSTLTCLKDSMKITGQPEINSIAWSLIVPKSSDKEFNLNLRCTSGL